MSLNDSKPVNYLIRIIESAPQIIDMKNSLFLFEKNKNSELSPRRDSMPLIINNRYSHKANSFSYPDKTIKNIIKSPSSFKNEEERNSLKEKFEKRLTENICNRKGFDALLKDPEIKVFIREK